jgi:histidinol-phosphate aminotransferase
VSETSPKLRAELEGIPTYKPGKPAAAGGPVAYKLSSNENPYPPLPGVMETVTAAASSFNRYPDMACKPGKPAAAVTVSITPGNGG